MQKQTNTDDVNNLLHASTLTIGKAKASGAGRFNIENIKQLSDSGFVPGVKYNFEKRENNTYKNATRKDDITLLILLNS